MEIIIFNLINSVNNYMKTTNINKTYTDKVSEMVQALKMDGMTAREISEFVGVTEKMVSLWLNAEVPPRGSNYQKLLELYHQRIGQTEFQNDKAEAMFGEILKKLALIEYRIENIEREIIKYKNADN